MGQAEDNKAALDAAQTAPKSSALPRIFRMVLCVLSMGMIYPNAFSESVDLQDYETRNDRTHK